jgi:hypothetical protein
MRPAHLFRFMLLVAALAVVPAPWSAGIQTAAADARSEARTAYQEGVKLYNAGDYKGAIRAFSQAQSLAPADLNNYNLALCYDKLGDAEPAVQYYKAYLEKVPSTDKRAEIEASVKRLEAAAKSAAAKRAEEERKAEETRKQLEAKQAEEAKKAEAKRIADEEAARKAEEAARKAEESKVGPNKPDRDPVDQPPTGSVGSTGTPSTGQTQTTGDAQLDRAQQIDINQIRDQRVGGSSSGMPDTNKGPAAVGTGRGGDTENPNTTPPPGDRVGAAGTGNTNAPRTNETPTDQTPKKPTPVYKKWWFWAVVAVSAYVVYTIATDDPNNTATGRQNNMFDRPVPPPLSGGGATVFRF